MKFSKHISKFLVRLTFLSLAASSIGCIQVSAMEQSAEWELENSVLPYMSTQTKLEFLTILEEFITTNLNEIPGADQNALYDALLTHMINSPWSSPAMYDSGNPFPSMNPGRKSSVLCKIKGLCTLLSQKDVNGLENFRALLIDIRFETENDPLALTKQHSECLDRNNLDKGSQDFND